MPQLEIHHADGNVTYAELSQQKPLLIGSTSNCDVVLSDPEVKRVHCRIVWRDARWRLEVAADAGTVQLGDKHVKAGTVRSGDVIGIAGCRIYLDEGAGAAEPVREPDHYAADLLHSSSAEDSAPAAVLGRGSIRKASHMKDTRGAGTRFWDTLRRKIKEQFQGEVDRPPGEERIMGSPLVRWLLVGFVVFGALAWYFYADFRNKTIEAHFDRAQKAMGEDNFEAASQLFTSFNELYPTHDLASNARVQKALCDVQSAGSPLAAMEAVRKMIRERSKEKAFEPIIPKIGEAVGRLAQTLADNARDRADPTALERSFEAQEIISRELPGAALSADALAKLEKTQEDARFAIKKYGEFVATRDKMDQAIAAGTTWPAYAARERLVQLYGKEFEENADLVDRMKRANKLDMEHVKWIAGVKNAETQARPGVLLASTTLVDRREFGTPADGNGDVVFCLAEGRISAHNVTTGKPVWSAIVGTDARWLPVPVPGTVGDDAVVLVTDTRHDELLAIKSRSGDLVWRQPFGEPLEAAPLVHRNRIYQPTAKGNMFVMDARTGRIDGRIQFGEQRFGTTPVADAAGSHLFLLGEQYVLYVITLSATPTCDFVAYLAHRPDSIFATPLRMERYLVIYENDTASETGNGSQMRVFLIEPDGTSLSEIQRPKDKLSGWVHFAPSVEGNLKFVATDAEIVEVWSGGPTEKAAGFKKETTAGQVSALEGTRPQAYSLRFTEKDILVHGSKVRHYEYKKEQSVLAPSKEMLDGAAVQPIQRYPASGNARLLFVARRIPGSAAVLFTALDAGSLEPRWEVQLGTGLVSLLPTDAAASVWVAVTRSGSAYAIPSGTLTAGGILDTPTTRVDRSRGEPAIELSDRLPPVALPDGSSVFASGTGAKMLYVRGAGAAAPLRSIEIPAALAAPAVSYDDGVLLPTTDGRIYYFSPAANKQLAEPFQPTLAADQPLEWRGVGVSNKKLIIAADSRGTIYQIELVKDTAVHLAMKNEQPIGKRIRSALAISGNVICCVDADNTLRTVEADGLTPIATAALSGPVSLGPVAAGGYIFAVAGDDEFVCVNGEGQLAWRHPLKGDSVVGRPLVKGDAVHFATATGRVRALRLSDGNEKWTIEAEIPLAGGPIAAGDALVVAGVDGNLNVVKAPAAAN
jgi:outer membrane protein assembly factor BamB